MKSKCIAGAFVFLGLLLFCKNVSAQETQCSTFDFPYFRNDTIAFFNCDLGEIQTFDKNNLAEIVASKKKLGGMVNSLIWSQDGKKAFVLAENTPAAVQELEFYSPDREVGSLNWWLYDAETGESKLLDKNIVSIGWITNDQVIYNWDNKHIADSTLGELALGKYVVVKDIVDDSEDIGRLTPIQVLGDRVIFPMEHGAYVIKITDKSATYYSLPSGIQKIATDPFGSKTFVIQSGSFLYKYGISENSLSVIENVSYTIVDFAFLDEGMMIIVDSEGKPYSYEIGSKIKKELTLNVSGSISRVFSDRIKQEVIAVVGDKIIKINLATNSLLQLGSGLGTQSEGSATQPSKLPSRGYIAYLIIVGAGIGVAVLLLVLYLRRKRAGSNKVND